MLLIIFVTILSQIFCHKVIAQEHVTKDGAPCAGKFNNHLLSCAFDYYNGHRRVDKPKESLSFLLCMKYINTIEGKVQNSFPEYLPDDAMGYYKEKGFRGFGENCVPTVEEEFHKSLLMTATSFEEFCIQVGCTPEMLEALRRPDNPLRIGEKAIMSALSTIWIKHTNDPVLSHQICNPRWFLECNKATAKCDCWQSPTLLPSVEVPYTFERLKTCHKWGRNCVVGNDTSLLHQDGFRCVAAESVWKEDPKKVKENNEIKEKNKEDGGDLPEINTWMLHLSSCEISLPIFAMCTINCQFGSECIVPTAAYGVEPDKVVGYWELGESLCCNQGNCTNRLKKENAAEKHFPVFMLIFISISVITWHW